MILQEDTTTEITPVTEIDPTIITEYHIISNDQTTRVYYFDTHGNIFKYRDAANDFETHFELDDNLKITAIVKKDVSGNTIEVLQDITYDSNGNISQINDRTFFYNTEENTYYEDSEHMQDGVLLNTQEDVFYNTYYYEEGNPMLQYCNMETIVELDPYYFYESCHEDFGWTTGFYNANLTSIFPHYYTYMFDNQRNPLHSNTNLKDIIAFIPELRQEMSQFYMFFSENNRIREYEPGGPPDEWFSDYEFNEYNLPTHRNSSYFYAGEQVGETQVTAMYYYQEE
ncbi:hypothetical protein GCM10011344_47260 [Dokdonia pacifica]|nr:hypothetical protein GCM10011344_47260 [Dokdonia pacifica]